MSQHCSKMRLCLALLVPLLGFVVGCSQGVSAEKKVEAIFVDSATGKKSLTFSLEVCSNDSERARGLMFRKSLQESQGMVFQFPAEKEHIFWMKNTFIPLDMLFISKDLRVVGILQNVPPLTEDQRSVGKPSMYVVELAGGVSSKLGIKVGDAMQISGTLPPVS
jgi:uncharacterized membrane protein (UPF0127 family)